jgi:hypothetical protein
VDLAPDLDDDDAPPTMPDDLGPEGSKLWASVFDEFGGLDPHHIAILEHACRQATLIARLESAVAKSGTRVKGAAGQWVISPEISELRMQKSAFITAMRALQLPGEEPETGVKMSRSESGRYAANVRWGNG